MLTLELCKLFHSLLYHPYYCIRPKVSLIWHISLYISQTLGSSFYGYFWILCTQTNLKVFTKLLTMWNSMNIKWTFRIKFWDNYCNLKLHDIGILTNQNNLISGSPKITNNTLQLVWWYCRFQIKRGLLIST